MRFLRTDDYLETISEDNLNQVLEVARGIDGDSEVLENSESKSITRAKEYLTARYKVNRIFAPFLDFDIADTYTYGNRIHWTATAWASGVYAEGSFVLYSGIVYRKNSTTLSYVAATLPTNATYFLNVGAEGIYYIAFPADYDEDELYVEDDLVFYSHEIYKKNAYVGGYLEGKLPTDTNYFDRIKTSEYTDELSVTSVYPTNAAWTAGDNRNQSIVEIIVNMTLNKIHAIINPRNIPQTRRDGFSNAIASLKEYQTGIVTADMPDRELTSQQGYSIKASSNEPTEHSY